MELIVLCDKIYPVEILEPAKKKMTELGITIEMLKESLLSLNDDVDDGDDDFMVFAPFGTVVGTVGEDSVTVRLIVNSENIF